MSITDAVATCLAFYGGNVIAGCSTGLIIAWDSVRWLVAFRFDAHDDAVTDVVVMDDRLISAGVDGTVRVWDIRAKEAIRVLYGHLGTVTRLVVAGGHIFSAGTDCSLIPYNSHDYHTTSGLVGHFDAVTSLAASRVELFSGSADCGIDVSVCDFTVRTIGVVLMDDLVACVSSFQVWSPLFPWEVESQASQRANPFVE